MPLVAKSVSTDKRIDITKCENPRLELKKGDLICPLCEQEMVIVQGLKIIPHFRHKALCTTHYKQHAESIEHLQVKKLIAEQLKEVMSEYSRAQVEFEYPIPEIQRIIDVAFKFPNGWIVAHEVQLSAITTKELEQRTNDYLKAGIDVFWWLGKSADTETNREWCFDRFGECLQIDYHQFTDLPSYQ
jgi:competence CoiA-like predicted nuclease